MGRLRIEEDAISVCLACWRAWRKIWRDGASLGRSEILGTSWSRQVALDPVDESGVAIWKDACNTEIHHNGNIGG